MTLSLATAPAAAPSPYIDLRTLADVRRWFESLSALGWPITYVGRACGHPGNINCKLQFGRISPDFADRLYEWFLDHQDQKATPRPGLTAAQIKGARWYARHKGWRTPDWYDDDGRPLGAREHHERVTAANKRARALDYMEILRGLINYRDDHSISAWVGCHTRTLSRIRRDAGLSGEFPPGEDRWVPDRSSLARLKEIELAIDAYLADPDGDPHRTLYDLGIVADRALDRERAEQARRETAYDEQIAS